MYHLKELPTLPTDPRLATSAPREPFIDEAAIHVLMQRHQPQWNEQRYFGEDFAGRDDCLLATEDTHALPVRHPLGAFFAPVHQEESLESTTVILTQERSVKRNLFLTAAAAVAVVATSLTGVWAAHAFTPAVPASKPPVPQLYSLSYHEAAENAETAMIVIDKHR